MNLSPLRDVVKFASGNVATLPAGKTSLDDRMRSLISSLHPDEFRVERRRERRYPYPCLLRLSPYDEGVALGEFGGGHDGDLTSVGMTVVGHEIALNGIGFYHQEPIADRLVVIEFPDEQSSAPLRVVVDLSWCRFAREGWYESGGRLVREWSE